MSLSTGVNLTKLVGYAVLAPETGVNVTKVVAYGFVSPTAGVVNYPAVGGAVAGGVLSGALLRAGTSGGGAMGGTATVSGNYAIPTSGGGAVVGGHATVGIGPASSGGVAGGGDTRSGAIMLIVQAAGGAVVGSSLACDFLSLENSTALTLEGDSSAILMESCGSYIISGPIVSTGGAVVGGVADAHTAITFNGGGAGQLPDLVLRGGAVCGGVADLLLIPVSMPPEMVPPPPENAQQTSGDLIPALGDDFPPGYPPVLLPVEEPDYAYLASALAWRGLSVTGKAYVEVPLPEVPPADVREWTLHLQGGIRLECSGSAVRCIMGRGNARFRFGILAEASTLVTAKGRCEFAVECGNRRGYAVRPKARKRKVMV